MDRIREAQKTAYSDAATWADAIQQGDRVALAKAISLVESHRPDDRPTAEDLLSRLAPHRVQAHR